MKKLLLLFCVLISCQTEPIEDDCGCIKTDWEFISFANYQQKGEPYEVSCTEPVTLGTVVKTLPEGSDGWSIECDL